MKTSDQRRTCPTPKVARATILSAKNGKYRAAFTSNLRLEERQISSFINKTGGIQVAVEERFASARGEK